MGNKLIYSIKRSNTADVWIYHRDGVGSVRAVTDANQNLVETSRTDAYGDHEVEAGAVRRSFAFTGEYRDSETWLQYHRARYYDPVIERFLSRDRVDGQRANPETLNRYAYALGDPMRFTDPSGHCSTCAGAIVILFGVSAWQAHQFLVDNPQIAENLGEYLASNWDGDISNLGQQKEDIIAIVGHFFTRNPKLNLGHQKLNLGHQRKRHFSSRRRADARTRHL